MNLSYGYSYGSYWDCCDMWLARFFLIAFIS
jgi:hypothetical protein